LLRLSVSFSNKYRMKKVNVTQPFLPPLSEFLPFLEKIWENKILTNCGPLHCEFEKSLCDFLGVSHISLFTNATIALITALQSLRITGEVITTPYSFVATSHALLWNGIKPVFVDIDPISLNIDPKKIEAAITPQTTAILPVHCYGRPCDVEAIQQIADRYNLRVIYDAAHAFGIRYGTESILRFGDLSVLSFHATKVFNTFEGGAIICPDEKTKTRIDQLKNFGITSETEVVATGINGKMSEFNAALGLLQLRYIREAIESRAKIDLAYRNFLQGINGIKCLEIGRGYTPNHAYFPILVTEDYPRGRDHLYQVLKEAGIYARRYFYPLISVFSMYRGLPSAQIENLSNAHRVARQILCLPIYPELEISAVGEVCRIIREYSVKKSIRDNQLTLAA
jgi:dTDP-4-amino-4,6-dideoxygalactose transaminase